MNASARNAASLFRLPFSSRLWRGRVGNWAGAGSGSSIDFQDHRPYVPGDDPRHLDWQAYARSGQYVMKLYREEVSPKVDLVLDGSRSMSFDEEKKARALELFEFVLESARRHQSSAHAWVVGEEGPASVHPSRFQAGDLFTLGAPRIDGSLLDRVPFRQGSLRVLVTDALFPDAPESALRRLVSGRGHGVVLAPSALAERSPEWLGEVDLEDCESGQRRLERIDERRIEDYRDRYRNHFAIWDAACRRYGIPFAQVRAEHRLEDALREQALPAGAVEPCR